MTESAAAQPTQEPVEPWSPIFHHDCSLVRRSFEAGIAAAAATPDRYAASAGQSRSRSLDSRQLRMRPPLALGAYPVDRCLVRTRLTGIASSWPNEMEWFRHTMVHDQPP